MKNWVLLVFVGVAAMFTWGPRAEAAEAIHNHTDGWNALWVHTLMDIGVIGLILAVVSTYCLIKFRRKDGEDIGGQKDFSMGKALAWGLIPAFIFLADDLYLAASGWKLWIDQRTVPENALEVKVTARSWGWDFEYENGAMSNADVLVEDNNVTGTDGEGLVVPVGKPVVLRMTSNDVVHSFSLADFRIKEDIMPGRVTYLWFYPEKIGEHVLTCVEYCGVNHSRMYGKLKIVSESDFAAWSEKNKG